MLLELFFYTANVSHHVYQVAYSCAPLVAAFGHLVTPIVDISGLCFEASTYGILVSLREDEVEVDLECHSLFVPCNE